MKNEGGTATVDGKPMCKDGIQKAFGEAARNHHIAICDIINECIFSKPYSTKDSEIISTPKLNDEIIKKWMNDHPKGTVFINGNKTKLLCSGCKINVDNKKVFDLPSPSQGDRGAYDKRLDGWNNILGEKIRDLNNIKKSEYDHIFNEAQNTTQNRKTKKEEKKKKLDAKKNPKNS